jgi:hypothetical protein
VGGRGLVYQGAGVWGRVTHTRLTDDDVVRQFTPHRITQQPVPIVIHLSFCPSHTGAVAHATPTPHPPHTHFCCTTAPIRPHSPTRK